MRHVFCDGTSGSWIGYDMTVSAAATNGTRQVSFGPAPESAMSDALQALAGARPLKLAPWPKFPPPQTVHDGDTIVLDLMVSADGKERAVDYLQFRFGAGTPRAAVAADHEPPADFTIDDGPVRFSAADGGEVFVNGERSPIRAEFLASEGGATFWMYVPGRGRYILSLAPHAGFVKSGIVHGSVIGFNADGRRYEIHTGKPVAGTERAWNLYVMHDPRYQPAESRSEVILVSADRLENLLAR